METIQINRRIEIYKKMLKHYEEESDIEFYNEFGMLDYGMCLYLINYVDGFEDCDTSDEIMELVPEIEAQKPIGVFGWWWHKNEREPRINAIKEAIKMAERNL